jgi:protein SCO1
MYCRRLVRIVVLVMALAGCRQQAPVREYRLVGQITAIDRATGYVTVRHDDIKHFMPAMTMPFAVRDRRLLEGHVPGDLVEATLQVQNADAWISRMSRTGAAPLPPAEPSAGGLVPGDRVPDQAFTGPDGRPLSLAWLDGHVSVLTFTYTRCPLADFCPAVDRRFRQLQDAVGEHGVRLLSVTLDPAFDTPAVLSVHAARVGANPDVWRFVTTGQEGLTAFGRQFGLDVRRAGSGAADIEHNLRTVVLDRDRTIVEMHTGAGWDAAALAGRLQAAAAR